MGGVVSGHGGQPRPLAVGEILPHGPVGVDIHQPGDQVAALPVQVRRPLKVTDGLDGLPKADIPPGKALANKNIGVFDEHR